MKALSYFAIVGLVAGALIGCDQESYPSMPYSERGPLELDNALVFVDEAHGSAIIVDPSVGAGETGKRRFVRVPLGTRVSYAVSIPGIEDPARNRVVMMDDVEGKLFVLSDKSGAAESVSTEIPVDTFLFRDDGKYAVAFDLDGQIGGDQFISFPNAVSVVNLSGPQTQVNVVRVGEASARPTHVAFAEASEFASLDGPRDFALLFLQNGVVALDLAAGLTGRVVPLGTSEDPMTPVEALFSNNRNDVGLTSVDNVERVFVRTASGRLLVLTVQPGTDGTLEVALDNIVTPSQLVQDIELYYTSQGEPKLLCATSAGLVVVNGYTGVAESYPLDFPISRLASYTEGDTGKNVVIAWNDTTHHNRFYLIEPGALRRGRSRGLEEMVVSQPIVDVNLALAKKRAVLEYANAQELGLVTLNSSRATDDLRLSASLDAHAIDPSGERILLTGYVPGTGRNLFASLDLDGLRNTSVELDMGGRAVGRVGEYYWVQHSHYYGSVTFIPVDDVSRAAATRFDNFMLFDVMTEDGEPADGDGHE